MKIKDKSGVHDFDRSILEVIQKTSFALQVTYVAYHNCIQNLTINVTVHTFGIL